MLSTDRRSPHTTHTHTHTPHTHTRTHTHTHHPHHTHTHHTLHTHTPRTLHTHTHHAHYTHTHHPHTHTHILWSDKPHRSSAFTEFETRNKAGIYGNIGCFKKSFTTLKAYRNLYRGHTQRFEMSKCSKTHRVLPRIVMVQCDFHW